MTLSDEKARLRSHLKPLRAALDEATRTCASLALRDRLWSFLQKQALPNVGVYLAQPTEISLDPLIETLLASNIVVSAPRLDLKNQAMHFIRFHSLEDTQRGPWKLREPAGNETLTPSLVLVPGLAFDPTGHRLGIGGGWYDRTLTPQMVSVGVCFDCQIIAQIPTEAHDQKMHWIFSDARQLGPFGSDNSR